LNNVDSFTHDRDGWTYYYEMATLTQTSPGEDATERQLRRVRIDQSVMVEDVD